ncbi:MAG: hypothetical protein KGI80_01165 [Verrucomicrobiota bacterium]|nr:hypothetical protein [Verrucomicrobiota bacterium]
MSSSVVNYTNFSGSSEGFLLEKLGAPPEIFYTFLKAQEALKESASKIETETKRLGDYWHTWIPAAQQVLLTTLLAISVCVMFTAVVHPFGVMTLGTLFFLGLVAFAVVTTAHEVQEMKAEGSAPSVWKRCCLFGKHLWTPLVYAYESRQKKEELKKSPEGLFLEKTEGKGGQINAYLKCHENFAKKEITVITSELIKEKSRIEELLIQENGWVRNRLMPRVQQFFASVWTVTQIVGGFLGGPLFGGAITLASAGGYFAVGTVLTASDLKKGKMSPQETGKQVLYDMTSPDTFLELQKKKVEKLQELKAACGVLLEPGKIESMLAERNALVKAYTDLVTQED